MTPLRLKLRALESPIPMPPFPEVSEAEQGKRALRAWQDKLGKRNRWHRKDETGLSPADRYFR